MIRIHHNRKMDIDIHSDPHITRTVAHIHNNDLFRRLLEGKFWPQKGSKLAKNGLKINLM